MVSLKKYKRPKIEVVLIKNDIITESIGPGGNMGGDEWEDIKVMNPLNRPLGIFKRD